MATRTVPPGAPAAAVSAAELSPVASGVVATPPVSVLSDADASAEVGAAASEVAGAADDALVESSSSSPHAASSRPMSGALMPATDARRTNSRRLMRPAT